MPRARAVSIRNGGTTKYAKGRQGHKGEQLP